LYSLFFSKISSKQKENNIDKDSDDDEFNEAIESEEDNYDEEKQILVSRKGSIDLPVQNLSVTSNSEKKNRMCKASSPETINKKNLILP